MYVSEARRDYGWIDSDIRAAHCIIDTGATHRTKALKEERVMSQSNIHVTRSHRSLPPVCVISQRYSPGITIKVTFSSHILSSSNKYIGHNEWVYSSILIEKYVQILWGLALHFLITRVGTEKNCKKFWKKWIRIRIPFDNLLLKSYILYVYDNYEIWFCSAKFFKNFSLRIRIMIRITSPLWYLITKVMLWILKVITRFGGVPQSFFQNENPVQDQDQDHNFTLDFNTGTTFYI